MKAFEIIAAIAQQKSEKDSPMMQADWNKIDDTLINADNGFVNPKKRIKENVLTELHDKVLRWEWGDTNNDGEVSAYFHTPKGQEIIVVFSETNEGDWDATFTTGESYEVTGDGENFIIFSTVLRILKDFAYGYQPTYIRFEADEPNRQRLYAKMLDRQHIRYDNDNGTFKLHLM